MCNVLQRNNLLISLLSTVLFYYSTRSRDIQIDLLYHFKYVLFILGEKSADLLDCLQMQSCAVYVTKSKKNTCLCTRKLCLKIKCSSVPQKDCTQLAVTCKMEKVGTNHSDCVTNTITDNHTGKRTPQSRSTFKNPKTV